MLQTLCQQDHTLCCRQLNPGGKPIRRIWSTKLAKQAAQGEKRNIRVAEATLEVELRQSWNEVDNEVMVNHVARVSFQPLVVVGTGRTHTV